MFPAALAIVVQTFPLHARGKALALFFGIAGGLTAVGPALGGVLDAVDLARDLLGEHPGRGDRADPDRALASGHRLQAGEDRLPGARPDRGRRRAQHLRLPAVRHLGLERSEDDRLRRRRRRDPRRVRRRRARHDLAADRREHLQDPAVRGREHRARDLEPRLHPDVLLRQRVRPALAREVGVVGEPRAPLFLHRLRDRGADRRTDARPGRCEAPRRDRLRARRGRVLALGQQGDRASTSARRSGS